MSRIAMLSNYNCNASGYWNAKMKTIHIKKNYLNKIYWVYHPLFTKAFPYHLVFFLVFKTIN